MKRRYKEGQCRGQGELFPERMDDYVGANHPIRVLDRYVEACNLEKLGFKNTSQNETNRGQPAYPPAALLKLYLYGYVNQFRSSRRLEKECQRNLEVMWLMQGLKPSYRTIANFRSENPRALRQVHKEFIIFCKRLDLFEEVSVAIDGSFFKANASRASFKTKKGLKKEQKKLEQYVRQWQKVTTSTDKREDELKGQASQQSIEQALERLEEIDELVQEWDEIEDEEKEVERSTTDKDAKKLSKSGQSCVGYNVQIAVDGKRDIILDAEPTSDNNDSQQLYPMASKAKQTLEVERLEVVADAGYFSAAQIAKCVKDGITPYIPEQKPRDRKEGERFHREEFTYIEASDIYLCPQEKELTKSGKPRYKNHQKLQRYSASETHCGTCRIRNQCITEKSKCREVWRSEHEGVMQEHKARMKNAKDKLRLRKSSVEHPFGTLKERAGWNHFLVRGREKVEGELALMVFGYNFTRLMNIFGVKKFMELIDKLINSSSNLGLPYWFLRFFCRTPYNCEEKTPAENLRHIENYALAP